jgi:inhibitor of KinA sporulation pathway (predicted exonuclease)
MSEKLLSKRSTLLVVDFEATVKQDNQDRPDFRAEIIEVGFCALHLGTLRCGTPEWRLIAPLRSGVGSFIERLTGITRARVTHEGITWADYCAVPRPQLQKIVWGSWGSWDRRLLRSNCEMNSCPSPFSDMHLDLKRLYWLIELQGKKPMGLGRALKREGLEFSGRRHSAGADAFNTARLMSVLLKRLRGGK